MPAADRKKIWDELLAGFTLGETELEDVKSKLGEPARTLAEEKVTVLEYEKPKATALARFGKVQLIFFDELLLNVSYVEPQSKLSRAKLHEALGAPDDTPDEEDEDGLSDIFEVELDADPMLSFVSHYDDEENLEALSLCAEISEDELDDGELEGEEDDEAGEDEDEDE